MVWYFGWFVMFCLVIFVASQALLRAEKEQELILTKDALQVGPQVVPQTEGFWQFSQEEAATANDSR